MKFFLPGAIDKPELAEESWAGIKKFNETNTGWEISSRRIYRLVFDYKGKTVTAQVGDEHPLVKEPVIVIFDSTTYLVCTPNRGVCEGVRSWSVRRTCNRRLTSTTRRPRGPND